MFSSKFVIGLLLFILAVHILATLNYWYWTFRWFDMPMHFLGGFWVASLFIWGISRYFPQFLLNRAGQIGSQRGSEAERAWFPSEAEAPAKPLAGRLSGSEKLFVLLLVLAFVALVGVLWEFFEFLLDLFILKTGYLTFLRMAPNMLINSYDIYRDTLSDLFFDLLGGSLTVAIFQFQKSKDFSL